MKLFDNNEKSFWNKGMAYFTLWVWFVHGDRLGVSRQWQLYSAKGMPEKRTAGLYWSAGFRRRACRRAGVALAPAQPRFTAFHRRRKSRERERERDKESGREKRDSRDSAPTCHSSRPTECYIISIATPVKDDTDWHRFCNCIQGAFESRLF